MFIGRKKELKELEKAYASRRSEVAIIFGRRRIGKTTLITEFSKTKHTLYFASQEDSAEENLYNLSKVINETNGDEETSVFPSFRSALLAIAKKGETEKIVFVIDELPYLCASLGSGILTVLQNFIDHEMNKSNIMLILCGSSVSFMENEVLSQSNPLFGRARTIMRLQSLSCFETGEWFPDYSAEDKALMFGITGGIPMYLSCMDPTLSVKENLLQTLFNPNSILFSEPENLMRQEVRDVKSYNATIRAIANGKTKFNEICDSTSLNPGMLKSVMDVLKNLGIVERKTLPGEELGKKGFYSIKDLFFHFWYFFVPRNLSLILNDRMEECYDASIKPLLNDYMGKVFETISIEYILKKAILPFPIKDIGSWWGTDNEKKKSFEVDIVAHSVISDDVIIGSCKFTNEAVDKDEYLLMKEYSEKIGCIGKRHFYFFSKGGFTPEMKAIPDITLLTLDDIYR